MTIGAPNVADTVPVAIGSVVQNHTPAMLSTLYGAGNIRTPTKNFSIRYNGHTLSYQKNVPFVVDAALLAALTAVNAPVV